MEDFIPFAYRCIHESMPYALAQLLLRLATPGVPDIYQGAEHWDLSFVDPDNRRPVNYDLRRKLLQQVKEGKMDGAEKMYIIYKTLAYRNTHRAVFEKGAYIPVDVAGAHLAFIRHYGNDWALVVVPLIRIGAVPQKELSVTLPEDAPAEWVNMFTGNTFHVSEGKLKLNDSLPLYLCHS